MEKLKGFVLFAVREFGPLLVFYAVNHLYGLKPAIVSSIVFGIGQILYLRSRGQRISTLLKFSLALTLVFGALDLYLATPIFIKYESVGTNILVGLFFALTLRAGETPLIQEFAEARWQKEGKVVPLTEERKYVLWFCTAVWAGYFFVKAAFYFWISSTRSLEQAMAIRAVVGNASPYALMFLNISFGKHLHKWLPPRRCTA